MPDFPLVSIVVPHYNGRELLYECMRALAATSYPFIEVAVVDNASTDASTASLEGDFPGVRLIRNAVNTGYAGGCNTGFQQTTGTFVLFLNNDTAFAPDWLEPLVRRMLTDDRIAAVQPKLQAQHQPGSFDYSGAAGGLMDRFGFPFALGRIFFAIEEDTGQYDQSQAIFWASGTAMLVRRAAIEQVGAFDEKFFAHMEEIDLCWRLQLAGWRIVSEPASVVLHNSGSTLRPDSFQKMYLNHRNSIIMLLKNYTWTTLFWTLPARLFMEVIAAGYSLLKLEFTRLRAVFSAAAGVLAYMPSLPRKRREIRRLRVVHDAVLLQNMYGRSIVIDYFVLRKKKVTDLPRKH